MQSYNHLNTLTDLKRLEEKNKAEKERFEARLRTIECDKSFDRLVGSLYCFFTRSPTDREYLKQQEAQEEKRAAEECKKHFPMPADKNKSTIFYDFMLALQRLDYGRNTPENLRDIVVPLLTDILNATTHTELLAALLLAKSIHETNLKNEKYFSSDDPIYKLLNPMLDILQPSPPSFVLQKAEEKKSTEDDVLSGVIMELKKIVMR